MSRQSYDEGNRHFSDLSKDLVTGYDPMLRAFMVYNYVAILPKTMYGYLVDITFFLRFLADYNPSIQDVKEINPAFLNQLNTMDFAEYTMYLSGTVGENDRTIARKLTALTRFLEFLLATDPDFTNIAFQSIQRPKIKNDKAGNLVYMEKEEISGFIDNVRHGSTLTDREKAFHNKLKARDTALLSLMLGTGIRVSECVALDLDDLDIKNRSLRLVRKGNHNAMVYFSESVQKALEDYLELRLNMQDIKKDHERALFISNKKQRISDDAVRNLVKKYAAPVVVGTKKITPHKLRSSYGMAIYEATDDIYAVQRVLGHESAETSQIYVQVKNAKLKDIGDIDVLPK